MTRRFVSLPFILCLAACESSSEKAPLAKRNTLDVRPSNPSCLAFARPQDSAEMQLQPAFGSIEFPLLIGLYRNEQRWYAVQRTGQISTFSKSDGSDKKAFIDLSGSINAGPNEAGLLGMAWHPKRKGEFYLSYTVASSESPANLRSVIARFKTDDGLSAANQPEILLTLEQPYQNHNGGHIAFGLDGYLYIAFGDGGSGGDPENRAQRLDNLFGKILRVDVDGEKPYGIPKDNPFVDRADAKPEIYAYGLRNPWRFQFDRETGELWAGDVGQNRFEEIDRIEKGGNYGWKLKEGFGCYAGSNCANADVIDPLVTYGRDQGASVTGGFVYRGNAIPSLHGIYLYADFVSSNVWGLFPGSDGKLAPRRLLSPGFNISSFAEDENGELAILEYGKGRIHQIRPAQGNASQDALPRKLSETGCFKKDNVREPVDGLIPYDVNSPLWSDGAAKRRWFAIPDDGEIGIADDGHLEFPNRTVLIKEFALGEKTVETRLFIRHEDGVWAGYTYAWNDEGTDAELVLNGPSKQFGDQTWQYPSQSQCLQCHSSAAGFSLGLEIAQLARDDGQLQRLEESGFFSEALPTQQAALPVPSKSEPNDAARSYLHANCSFCHRPAGSGGGGLDLRFTANLKQMGVCNRIPSFGDMGIAGGRLVVPGAAEKSVLLARISKRGAQQMPPLASAVVDEDAKAWVEGWIKGLTDCQGE